MTNITPKE